MFDKLITFLEKNRQTLAKAPLVFIVSLALGSVLGYYAASNRYAGVIETQEQRLVFKDEQMTSYKARLDIQQATATSIAQTPNKALRQKTFALVGELREFLKEGEAETMRILMEQTRAVADVKKEEDKNRIWRQYTDDLMRQSNNLNQSYARRFKAEAILLRDELSSRLQIHSQNQKMGSTYEHPISPIGMEEIATELELLAKRLPD